MAELLSRGLPVLAPIRGEPATFGSAPSLSLALLDDDFDARVLGKMCPQHLVKLGREIARDQAIGDSAPGSDQVMVVPPGTGGAGSLDSDPSS